MSETNPPLPPLWQTLAEASGRLEPATELSTGPARPPEGIGRRGFFKMMGLSAGAAALACRRAPVQKIVPFLRQPEDVLAGTALFYATTCGGCPAGCGALVKSRDGRPVKLEGNDLHPLNRGGLCPVGQASVLSLYDSSRARGPFSGGAPVSWAAQDAAVREGLAKAKEAGSSRWLVLPPVLGPTAEAAVQAFAAANPGVRIARREPLGQREAVGRAYALAFGARAVPQLRLGEAAVIASFGADFLGTWLAPAALTRSWVEGRRPDRDRKMSRLIQVEAMMSLTGTNADLRLAAAPGDVVRALAAVLGRLARRAGASVPVPDLGAPELPDAALDGLAESLWDHRGSALVLSGSDDPGVQLMAVAANELLGAHGHTVRLDRGQPLGEGEPFEAFLEDLRAGAVGAVLLWGQNPVHDHPDGEAIAALLAKVPLSASLAGRMDETAKVVHHLAPDHDPLESWGDAEPRRGVLGLRQPAVAPLFETRAAAETLLAWAGAPRPLHDVLRERWEAEVFPRAGGALTFGAFWDAALERGFVELEPADAPAPTYAAAAVGAALADVHAPPRAEVELVLYAGVPLGDGALANNAWLHELPDPVTKACWSSPLCVPVELARRLGIEDGQLVSVEAGGRSVEAPALVQPGLHPRAVALPLGYGRTAAGSVGNGVGVNGYALAAIARGGGGGGALSPRAVTVTPRMERRPAPVTQTHGSREGRPIVQVASLEELLSGRREVAKERGAEPSMWARHQYPGHRWGMAVDLTACTGCSACVIACQAENNIPSVGPAEVARHREMHWMRIDRYYEGPPEAPTAVVHQPMMCQHCENAPCETVCPVVATVHSSEGLNQQVYNRCVGTRYCANNCPPKVRRFNWFDYPHDDPLARMVLNPDVVVRSRGVMEKCSLCVQRIEEGKAAARREGRPLRDGEIRTACQQTCPAQAITFGDLNDPASALSKLAASGRAFKVLEEINVGPVVSYLSRIRNTGSDV